MAFPLLQELTDVSSLSYHLENSSFGVLLWDAQMKLVYCSKGAAALFGYTPEDLLHTQLNLLQVVHADDVAEVASHIEAITSGRITHNESLNRNLTKEGQVIYCQWYNSALKDEDGQVINILSLCQDVTPKIETQLALKKSEQLALAFNSAIDPMWLIRKEENNGFRFENINIAFTKVTGWTREQVEGQPIEQIMPAASHQLVRDKYNEALASGRIVDYVEEAAHPSGIKYGEIRVIPILGESGEPERILGIANDITERVYLQKKLDVERENRRRHITAAAIRGQESERSKVSRELHDNVNQVLTTVKLYIELCIDQKVDMAAILPKCAVYLTNTINEIRGLSKQLSAPTLGNMNFKETLNDLAEAVRSSSQIEVVVDFDTLPFRELESELHLTLYRVAQEQLTNIIKYAKATRVEVVLSIQGAILFFSISDNGVGFDIGRKRGGIGITNMQSRVEILNGRFSIFSAPGAGTRVSLEIPVYIQDDVCYAEQVVKG